ncbi:MAG: ATP-binding protein [Hyphomicrobiaceae bacterium]
MSKVKNLEISDEVYISLVDSLFKEVRSLFLGSLFTGLAMAASFWKTGNWTFLIWTIAFFVVASIRIFGIHHYNRTRNPDMTRQEAERWDLLYTAGATMSVALLGSWCFLAFAITTEPYVQLVSFSMTIGYIIGIFSRNFGNPRSAGIQTASAGFPMTAGLLISGDPYLWFFAVLLAPLFLAVKFLANRVRSILLEAIEARHRAESALRGAEEAATKARKARTRVLDLLGRLRQSRRSEEAAIATRDQHMRFLATMSHEIRTPLNGIVGALELMSTSRAEKMPELLKTATASADALLELVSEVLDLAKLDYGDAQPESRPFSVTNLVEIVQLALAPIARGKGLSLEVKVDDDVPGNLFGDPAKIRQVLINLVGNALKFTDAGMVRVSVRLISKEDGRVNLEFEVRDTGIGIAAEDIDKIYGPFFTGKEYRRSTQSSGLGLSIVEKAIKSMNGSIRCESEVGVGTTFKMQLAMDIDTNPEQSQPDPELVVERAPVEPGRILLVEDNETNAMIVEDMLEETPHSVQRAAGGLEAVELATKHDFDVILMDISMPDIDGMTACHRIREARGADLKARIVALTANAVVGDRERFLNNGFDGYLSKPIRRAVLISAIEDMLSMKDIDAGESIDETEPEAEPMGLDQEQLADFIAERSPDRACRLLDIFSSEMAKHRANIEEGYSASELDPVHHSLHSIVGMAGSVGAARLGRLALGHEAECRNGVMPSDADMTVLMDEISRVVEESAVAQRELAKEAA